MAFILTINFTKFLCIQVFFSDSDFKAFVWQLHRKLPLHWKQVDHFTGKRCFIRNSNLEATSLENTTLLEMAFTEATSLENTTLLEMAFIPTINFQFWIIK